MSGEEQQFQERHMKDFKSFVHSMMILLFRYCYVKYCHVIYSHLVLSYEYHLGFFLRRKRLSSKLIEYIVEIQNQVSIF